MTPPPDAADSGGLVISRIMGNLLNEIFAFAQFAGMTRQLAKKFSVERPGHGVIEGYTTRFQTIARLVEITDREFDLQYAGEIPYIYNGARWDGEHPGGYLGTPGAPSLSAALTSFYALVGTLRDDSKLPLGRVFKATTYICWRRGYAAAVDYVLDLIEYGYIPDNYDAARCLTYILDADTRKDPAAWARHRIRKIDELHSGSAWVDADIRGRIRSTLKASAAYNEQVINRVLERIEAVRDATDSGRFLSGQLRLHRVASALLALHREATGRPPLALQTLMYDLEEIQADAIAIADACHDLRLGRDLFVLSDGIVRMAEHNQPGASRRIEATRALAPRALARLPSGLLDEIPARWDDIPAWLAIPVSVTALRHDRSFCLPSIVDNGGIVMEFGDGSEQEVAKLADAESLTPTAEMVDRLSDAVHQFPWSVQLRLRLANSLVATGRPDEARPHAEVAIHLEPGSAEAWQTLTGILRLTASTSEAADAEHITERVISREEAGDNAG